MFDWLFSLHNVSKEDLNTDLEIVRNRISSNDNTIGLVALKRNSLYVLIDLRAIINEICDCLIIGCNQAAITLTNHLFENALKHILITWDSQGRRFSENQPMEETFKKEVKRYDNKNLNDNIEACKERNLISEEEANRLKELKINFRNPLSHASYMNLFKNVTIPIWRGKFNNPGHIVEEKVNIATVPSFSVFAQKEYANKCAFGYFIEIYAFIGIVDKKLLDLYPDTKAFVEKGHSCKDEK